MPNHLLLQRLLLLRLATAALQGAALYALLLAAERKAWPATQPALFAALLLAGCFAPLVTHAAAGQLGRRALAAWTALVATAAAALGWFAVSRNALPPWPSASPLWPDWRLWFALGAALFIAHVRLVDCLAERRLFPTYARHFDTAWKLAVQLGLAGAFLGVFWALLGLASQLFGLVGLDLWRHVFSHAWFHIPASTLAVGLALHLTDVQPALIRGVRGVVLLLFAWLLPLLVLLLAGFLAALAGTGLGPLWGTGQASAIVLACAAVLVLLLNAAYQDGTAPPSRPLRFALRAGAVLVLPLAAIAAFSLALRVAQHGWTSERITVAAVILVALVYGAGYALAARRAGLPGLQATNHAAAHLIVVLILALHTPLADPARLMVASQLARLSSGAVAPERFDVMALRLDGARWGNDALEHLARTEPALTPAARNALLVETRSSARARRPEGIDLAARLAVHPPGTPMPDGLAALIDGVQLAGTYLHCLGSRDAEPCAVRRIDLGPDRPEAVLVATGIGAGALLLTRAPGATWQAAGNAIMPNAYCPGRAKWLTADTIATAPPTLPDLVVDGIRVPLVPMGETRCPP